MELPYQNNCILQTFKGVPINFNKLIFADSRYSPNQTITAAKNTPLLNPAEQFYIINMSDDFDAFRDAIIQQLKSAVKTILVLFCEDGVEVLKQLLLSGLDKIGSLERVLILGMD